jgi:hypothetical protein
MSHLTGQWELQQLAAAGPDSLPATKVTYAFEMWPKGELKGTGCNTSLLLRLNRQVPLIDNMSGLLFNLAALSCG